MKEWIIWGGVAALILYILRNGNAVKQKSPLSIQSLETSVGQGPSAEEEVQVFDRLFSMRDASNQLKKWKVAGPSYNIRFCHSGGELAGCNLGGMVAAGTGLTPIEAPRYFLEYLLGK